MSKNWKYFSAGALIIAAFCLGFDWYISNRGNLDLTVSFYGLEFGVSRFSSDSSFYWYGVSHLIPLDEILYCVAIVAVLLAMVFAVKFLFRKKWVVAVILGVVLACGTAVHLYYRSHVDGVFDDLQMACDCQWVFKGGKIYMESGNGRDMIGTYTRSGGRWICRPLKGLDGEFYIESSLFGIWWPDTRFKGGGKFLPRRGFSPVGATLYSWHIRV